MKTPRPFPSLVILGSASEEALIARPVQTLEQVLGQVAQVGIAVVQHPVDRPLFHGLEQLVDVQRRIIRHAEGGLVSSVSLRQVISRLH
jgi:hypothetical protein